MSDKQALFLTTLAKAKENQQAKAARQDKVLFGSGLTKRTAERAERKAEHEREKAFEAAKQPQLLQPEFDASVLPSTMMSQDIALDPDQQAALDGLYNQKYGCIIGRAGTGKTTVSKALIQQIENSIPLINHNEGNLDKPEENWNLSLLICSFMGKAVQNIKRALPKEYHMLCDTIHGALGYAPVFEECETPEGDWIEKRVFRPYYTAENKLHRSVVIIDEAGTVPVYLFNQLIAALPKNTRIILMGDINQLPPVTGRSVLGYAMNKWPTYGLEQMHRQTADSSIIANAHRVIEGKPPLPDEKSFLIVDLPAGGHDTFQTACGVIQHLHKAGKFDPMRDAFIVPQNTSTIGQMHFNEKLVMYFNPPKELNGIVTNPRILIKAGYAQVLFAVGDKIMITSNERQLGLTNGMIGVVESITPNDSFKGEAHTDFNLDSFDCAFSEIDLASHVENLTEEEKATDEIAESERQASHIMRVKFQNVEELVEFKTAGAFKKLVHSYAITGHKSQGGEYPTVVILLHSANSVMLNREWLYTVITRAKERVILLRNLRGIANALRTQRIPGRTLKEKMAAFIEIETKNDGETETPNLSDPVTIDLKEAR